MKTRAIAVWWEDAFSHDPWTHDADSLIKQRCLVVSVGMELANDEKGIVIAVSMNAAGQRGGLWKIPRGMIRKVRVLGTLEAPDED